MSGVRIERVERHTPQRIPRNSPLQEEKLTAFYAEGPLQQAQLIYGMALGKAKPSHLQGET